MKKLLVGIFVLTSTLAFAHPTDEESFSKIGIGSKIKVLEALNVIPGLGFVSIGISSSCKIRLKEKKDYDRALPEGKEYQVKKIEVTSEYFDYADRYKNSSKKYKKGKYKSYSGIKLWERGDFRGTRTTLKFNNPNLLMDCFNPGIGERSIGQVKQSINGYLEIVLADPTEI